jgi:hypothetical protein
MFDHVIRSITPGQSRILSMLDTIVGGGTLASEEISNFGSDAPTGKRALTIIDDPQPQMVPVTLTFQRSLIACRGGSNIPAHVDAAADHELTARWQRINELTDQIATLQAEVDLASQETDQRPSLILMPQLSEAVDGRTGQQAWTAEYDGLIASGGTPEEAYRNFDAAWFKGTE